MARRLLGISVMSLVLIASAFAGKPKVTVDKSADFTLYKTYAWVPGTAAPSPMMNTIIIATIDYELQRAGLRKVDDMSAAHLLVRYDADGGVQASYKPGDPTYATTGGIPLPTASMWDSGGQAVTVLKGAISIRLFDLAKQHVVWTSTQQESLEETASRRHLQVNKLVSDMFKDFPPKK